MFGPSLTHMMENRMEFRGPDSGYLELKECLFLFERGYPMYNGGVCHHQPLLVYVLSLITSSMKALLGINPQTGLAVLYSLLDVSIGYMLFQLLNRSMSKYPSLFAPYWKLVNIERLLTEEKELKQYHDKLKFTVPPLFVMGVYLFNPLSIISCLSRSTTLFSNFFIASSLYSAFNGKLVVSAFVLSLAAYLSLYPVLLLLPISVLLYKIAILDNRIEGAALVRSCLFCCLTLSSWLLLILTSAQISRTDDSTDFNTNLLKYLKGTYGFILTISDLSVNIGPYWYLFSEIFEQFRSFFLAAVQLHLFSFSIPVTIKFRDDPLFAVFILYGTLALLKSYPSLPDFTFWLAFLFPTQAKVFKYLRNTLVSFSGMLFSLILLPSFHYIWIYLGSGNSNFCYAITLVFAISVSLIIGDCMSAWLRRTYDVNLVSKVLSIDRDKDVDEYDKLHKLLGEDVVLK